MAKRVPRSAKPEAQQDDGNNVRALASKNAVVVYIKDVIAAKNRTSTIGQELSESSKRAANANVNVPAARLACRFYSKALMDGLKARILLEDVLYYLECLDFDTFAPKEMISSSETRSVRPPRQLIVEPAPQQPQAEAPPVEAPQQQAEAPPTELPPKSTNGAGVHEEAQPSVAA